MPFNDFPLVPALSTPTFMNPKMTKSFRGVFSVQGFAWAQVPGCTCSATRCKSEFYFKGERCREVDKVPPKNRSIPPSLREVFSRRLGKMTSF